jgi:hypothetical protein
MLQIQGLFKTARWHRRGDFGALSPLLVADVMRGTGCYNLSRAQSEPPKGIDTSSSGLIVGIIVYHRFSGHHGLARPAGQSALGNVTPMRCCSGV